MMQFIQKLNKLIQPASKTFKDYYLFENVFDSSEIMNLKAEMRALENNPAARKDRAVASNGRHNKLFSIHFKSALHQSLAEKLNTVLPFGEESFEFFSMNFYKLQIPYALHCDNLGPEIGHYQIVIPLHFEPEEQAPHTILFDQTSPTNTEWIAKAYNKKTDYKPFHNKAIYNANFYPHWSDEYKISEADGVGYWGLQWDRMYREAYKGFSIRYAYKWKIGDVFVFNSHFNHCASMLGEEGLADQKDGILVCLQKPKKN